MVFIRDAIIGDIPILLELSKVMHQESRYKLFDLNDIKYKNLLTRLIQLPAGIVFVAELNNKIIGLFLGHVSQHFFGDSNVSGDLIFYVRPKYRGNCAGELMVKEYIRQAHEKGADDVCISNSTGINLQRIGEFYKRLGFTQTGGNFSL